MGCNLIYMGYDRQHYIVDKISRGREGQRTSMTQDTRQRDRPLQEDFWQAGV